MSTKCVISRQSLMGSGYPQIQIDGVKYSQSRLICADAHGLDYDDKSWDARHTCNNRACVNPDHLIPGTRAENLADRIDHGTNGKRLTKEQVLEIKYDWPFADTVRLAGHFGVSKNTISQIRTGKTWRHL